MAGKETKISAKLTSLDWITILYILLSGLILVAGTGRLEHTGVHYLVRGVMLVLIWLIIRLEYKFPRQWTRALHQLYPLLFLSWFFPETDFLNNIFMDNLDPLIIHIEMAVFGFMPSMAFDNCCPQPWFSELMHLGYFSFYLILTFFAIYYYTKLPALFNRRVFVFFQSFYILYLIFALFPSAGPHYVLHPDESSVPGGYLFTHLMNTILFYGDRPTGAFPSSHIAMTWLVMYFFFKDQKKLFYGWLLPAVLLTFSTVYLKEHYVVDVIGGLLIFPLLNWSGNRIYSLFFANRRIAMEKVPLPKSPPVSPSI